MEGTSTINLNTDYLVIGAGVSGMGFVDELLRRTKDLKIIIVDKHSKPSGHWNDAYDFVTLHQPAMYYGLNSKELGRNEVDLASHSEILAYYEEAMRDFLASGRVRFFPQSEYTTDGEFHSLVVPDLKYKVDVRRKIVNATYVGPTVPSTSPPQFEIATGVNFVPINELSHIQRQWKRYVILGGGKTGIDAVLFLLNQSVSVDCITWIIPNDYWFIIRDKIFPSKFPNSIMEFFDKMIKSQSIDEAYKNGEDIGYFGRLDTSIEPTRIKAGTVSLKELKQLRSMKNIVRKGRVTHIESTRVIFKDDFIEIDENTLNVDCTACGVPPYIPRKIFDGNTITIQEVSSFQVAFSACVIAAYESLDPALDEETKNCDLKPISHPIFPAEFLMAISQNFENQDALVKTLGLRWYFGCRLQLLNHAPYLEVFKLLLYFSRNDKAIKESLKRLKESICNL